MISVLVLIFSGIVFNVLIQVVLFYISFLIHRKTSGGFHAKSEAACSCLSVLILLVVIMLIKVTPSVMINPICITISLICVLAEFTLAPIDHPNKRFSYREWKFYKKTSKIISLCSAAILMLFPLKFINNVFVYSIAIGIAVANISLFISFVERRLKDV